jgi:hypothetical protein
MDIRQRLVLRTSSETAAKVVTVAVLDRIEGVPQHRRSALTPVDTVPVEPAPAPRPTRPARPPRWRVSSLTGATLVLIGGAVVTMGASPEPSTGPAPDMQTQPDGSGDDERLFRGPFMRGPGRLPDGFAGFAGPHLGFGAGNITITAIDGSSISLETVDGWTRTITVTDETQLSKDGDEIALAELEVGDKVRFRQAVDDNGTWTVTAIAVVSPSVLGQVTAVDGDSITLSQRDGSSVTVHVDSSTAFTVSGESGKSVSDVEVGMIVVASGDENDDGSLDAARVRAGTIWDGIGKGRGHMKEFAPEQAPSTVPDQGSTSAG